MWATERDIDNIQLQALDIAALSSLLLCSFTTWSKELEIFHKNPECGFCPQLQWHSDKSQTEKSHCLKWSILSAASKSRNYHICTNPISLGNTAAVLGFRNQATHRRLDDEPIFYFGVQYGQSRVWRIYFGAKNQFWFEMVQKGPDGPKRVPNGQKQVGWPFQSLLDSFGRLWNVDKPAMFGHFWAIPFRSYERCTVGR